jgi:hypothetical protein
LAKNLAGTAFQEIILPIINPLEIAKDFFSNHSTQVSNEDYNSINELNKA